MAINVSFKDILQSKQVLFVETGRIHIQERLTFNKMYFQECIKGTGGVAQWQR